MKAEMRGFAMAALFVAIALGQNSGGSEAPGPMSRDASPGFEVATVKPSDPAGNNSGFKSSGRRVFAVRETVKSLITFAYGVHESQVVDGPSWIDTEYFDVNGQPDQQGVPNLSQMRTMYRKLLADRFGLVAHSAKRELPVYVLSAGKGAAKLAPSQRQGNLPDQTMRRSGLLAETNATMEEFAGSLQVMVLDRPVLDRTGITGRFDFTLHWTPDELLTAGGGRSGGQGDGAPSLFTAVQEQLGLKLESTKAQADVLVIEKVQRPSEN